MTKEEACGLLADDTVAIGRPQRPEALGCLKVNGRIKERRLKEEERKQEGACAPQER